MLSERAMRPEAGDHSPAAAREPGTGWADPSPTTLQAAAQTLDMIAFPAFLLAPDTRILASNAAGRLLLQRSPAFLDSHGKLAIRRTNDEAALSEAVQRSALAQQPVLLRFLTRQEEASALMRIAPVLGQPLVTVCITELRAPLLLAPGWSRAAFGFSPQNAALAESLAIGRSLAEFAELEALPIGTVRTRLKKLLLQTGTSSQAQLAAMLLRASGIMAGAEGLAPDRKGRKTA
ncbi:helix-turn-helix transcriptional regulator [Acidisoma sp. 7E03]